MSFANGVSRSGSTGRATSERSAPSARPSGTKSATAASASRSTATAPPGSAITADGPAAFGKLTAAAIAYAKERGISRATLERLGAASGMAFFPGRLNGRSEAVFFPYVLDGETVNWKACAFPEKDFIGKKGGKLCFLGLDDVLAADPGDVWLVEGEWDRASLVEAGIPAERVLSVPNGARAPGKAAGGQTEGGEGGGYGYVADALERGLGRHKRFILAGDSDEPGHALRHALARMLGQARCWYVEWPEGCKDANDHLRHDGPEAVRDLVVDGALQWPVAGLYQLDELPEPPVMDVWNVPNFPSWHSRIRLAPRTLSMVIGHPGHGKTALWGQIWHDVAAANDLVVAVASFETRPKHHFRRMLRSLQAGMPERDMLAEQTTAADRWINDHYRWILHPEEKPTLEWFLDTAEVAVVRHGAKVVQLDPWNRLESQRNPNEWETDYIGRCLTAAHVFACDMNVHFQILLHPSKMDGTRRGKPPDLEDAAGSKHFENRVDQGFVVHRSKMFDGAQAKTEADFYHRKTRFEELGHPCKMKIKFDWRTRRFVEQESEGE
jgi:twinkle protein